MYITMVTDTCLRRLSSLMLSRAMFVLCSCLVHVILLNCTVVW